MTHSNTGTGKRLNALPQDGLRRALVVMRDANEFFQKKARECTVLAYAADHETDREFWLRLARRWEELQQPHRRKHTQPEGGPLRRKYGLGRFTKSLTLDSERRSPGE